MVLGVRPKPTRPSSRSPLGSATPPSSAPTPTSSPGKEPRANHGACPPATTRTTVPALSLGSWYGVSQALMSDFMLFNLCWHRESTVTRRRGVLGGGFLIPPHSLPDAPAARGVGLRRARGKLTRWDGLRTDTHLA